ncbi:hypothetical protein BBD42_19325 [Paenibacillus sp. BIHB 4019]|uniref:6-hydroxymethylpterin diphosphokinase MptE-like domain-containing protein n=1 Tax=Paenibacillus sp. BIHB 4019 TaxID=1870819 RepID=A0A1B2DL03_9BACL|nr:6-hydroxymethylpterin diphosphokinase MptE-like protein [Paenibacillus sp. BIHB 4019]ANY68382.1 hypothetical protein BBD42_19325 [Paenibacillus sp. BIHB 4019]
MFLQNLTAIKEHRPDLFRNIQHLEQIAQMDELSIKQDSKNLNNLICEINQQSISLHLEENPVQEADKILLEVAKEINQQKHHVIFYGTGLGHHIRKFTQMYPNVPYSIFEPSAKILIAFFSYVDIKELNIPMLRNISLGSPKNQFNLKEIKSILYQIPKSFTLITLPSYLKILPIAHNKFLKLIQTVIHQKKINLSISQRYEKKWITNSFENFAATLNTPNLFDFRNHFQHKPALLVAAGPSLQDEIDQLRIIKQQRSAYIISVGSAINTLVEFKIIPDAAFTYDPSELNYKVFQKAITENKSPFPMVFGTSVGTGVVAQFPWKKIHLPMSQDMLYGFYISGSKQTPVLSDASSIAIVALQALMLMNCSSIILVGQNFALRDKQYYAAGVPYEAADSKVVEQVISVENTLLETNPGLNAMRKEMEYVIRLKPSQTIINTTKGGAKIDGAPFQTLSSVIDTILVPNAINKEWFAHSMTNPIQFSYLTQRQQQMLEQESQILPIFATLQQTMADIQISPEKSRFQSFDFAFKSLQDNLFFKFILHPLTRVKYEILYSYIMNIKIETDINKKKDLLLSGFGQYLYECYEDYKMIQPYFHNLNVIIDDFTNHKKE